MPLPLPMTTTSRKADSNTRNPVRSAGRGWALSRDVPNSREGPPLPILAQKHFVSVNGPWPAQLLVQEGYELRRRLQVEADVVAIAVQTLNCLALVVVGHDITPIDDL